MFDIVYVYLVPLWLLVFWLYKTPALHFRLHLKIHDNIFAKTMLLYNMYVLILTDNGATLLNTILSACLSPFASLLIMHALHICSNPTLEPTFLLCLMLKICKTIRHQISKNLTPKFHIFLGF